MELRVSVPDGVKDDVVWRGDPKWGVTWKSVSCDVPGDIVGLFNNGYAGQIYFPERHVPGRQRDQRRHQRQLRVRILGLRQVGGRSARDADRRARSHRHGDDPRHERGQRRSAVPGDVSVEGRIAKEGEAVTPREGVAFLAG